MSLIVENLSYEYSQGARVLDDLSMRIEDGEHVALIGPSGCGKSTLLHCIIGLVTPMTGRVHVDGDDISHKNPHDRGIGIMMQDQPLYEHLSVEQNIAFPLRARGQKNPSVARILEQLQLADIAKQKVSSCSGGERRRVAFGRAIVTKPKVLLMDEPFVSLNEELRETMRELIKLSDVTTLLVTHEFEESSALYDRVIEMEKL
ncbi:MAG: ABC transporter ATP-binding protein [Phycisphaerales bacterium]